MIGKTANRQGDVRHDVRRVLLEGPRGILSELSEARQRRDAGGRKSAHLGRRVEELERLSQHPPLLDQLLVIPLKKVPLRVAKFDVRLKEASLRAVHAQQSILSSMVMFSCNWCAERFPTFHLAYEPPEWLRLELLKRGANGVAACNIHVASWDTLPEFPPPDGLAAHHTGTCLACQADIEQQHAALPEESEPAGIVPKRSILNHMDPVFRFPYEELQQLFDSASLIESMLVSLDHMQVNFVTVYRTQLLKFRKNIISFPQDIAAFARRVGLLDTYKVSDRVNSVRGPGDNLDRLPMYVAEVSAEVRQDHGVDEFGRLVFAATVTEVRSDGSFLLSYDSEGQGVETPGMVTPRVRMPWNPKFLKGLTNGWLSLLFRIVYTSDHSFG